MNTTLERTTFQTNRLLEFFTAKELQMQIGHHQDWWPVALVKELIDNALDACEAAGIPPEIEVVVELDAVSVRDNGPGLPIKTLERSLDYSVRVSDKTYYVSPTRGQLGNALKCVWAAPFVVKGEQGRVDIITGGDVYRVGVTLDRIAQQPRLEIAISPDGLVKTGTLVKMHWSGIASYLTLIRNDMFYNRRLSAGQLVQQYAAFNPHASFGFSEPDWQFIQEPTAPEWRKWSPGDPISPHWYNTEQMRALIAAYVADERCGGNVRTVREFVSEFKGLTSTAKQKRVTEVVDLSGAYLHDLVKGDDIDETQVRALLAAMQNEARPVSPKLLGVIGEEHFADWLVQVGHVASDSVRYANKDGTTSDGLPFVVEAAFGVYTPELAECGLDVVTGLNWTPALKPPFSNIYQLLSENHVDSNDPVVIMLHLVCPLLEFTDRGKSTLRLSFGIAEALRAVVGRVTAQWRKMKARKRRNERAQERELDEIRKARRRRQLNIKDAAYQVMGKAYLKASGGGRLPANARQIMYAARPEVLNLTGGKCWKNSSYFTQQLLPDYVNEHSETANWDVVFDARGRLIEPHTGNEVPLGTLEVRRYIARWTNTPSGIDASFAPHLGLNVTTTGPTCRYRFVLFVEKEGFNELWRATRIAEGYDLAIMSTKGMSVTAARHLVEELSKTGVTILVLRDFDKAGFSIVNTLQSNTRRYSFDERPNVIDLGFRLEDIGGLERERVEYNQKVDPRVNLQESGATEKECNILVQGRHSKKKWYGERVELNAMTSDQLVAWLERKLEEVGVQKVIPDGKVLEKAYKRAVMLAKIQDAIDEAYKNFDGEAVEVPENLSERVRDKIESSTQAWDSAIWTLAASQ